MKLAWFLVVLYTGPIGLFIYLLSCRQPLPGTHDAFIAPHWKQAVGSLLHCVAGDATGIIVSAAIVYHFGLPNGVDLIIEYLAAFIVGLFLFQALFMLDMYNGLPHQLMDGGSRSETWNDVSGTCSARCRRHEYGNEHG